MHLVRRREQELCIPGAGIALTLKAGETIVAGPYQAIRDLKEGARVRPSRESSDTTRRRS